MTDEVKKCLYYFALNTKRKCDTYKEWDIDQNVLMRLALIRTLAENIEKYTED